MIEKLVHKLRVNSFYDIVRSNQENVLTFDCKKKDIARNNWTSCILLKAVILNFTICVRNSWSSQTKDNTYMFLWKEIDYSKETNKISSAVSRMKLFSFQIDAVVKIKTPVWLLWLHIGFLTRHHKLKNWQ